MKTSSLLLFGLFQYILERSFCFGLLCLFFVGCKTIKPEGPLSGAIPDTPPVDKILSVASIPVTVDLQPLLHEANASLDRDFSKRESPCKGVRYSVEASRDDLGLTIEKDLLNFNTKIRYGARATYCGVCLAGRCIVPKITASCGVPPESKRIVRIGINSKVNMLPDYRFHTDFKIREFDPENRCRVFVVNYDVTDKIMGVARPRFEDLLNELDHKVAQVSIKSGVEKIWMNIQNPMKIGNFGYLKLNPQSLGLSNIHGEGTRLFTKIELSAFPTISNDTIVFLKPLPSLADSVNEDGFNIQFDFVASTDSLSNILTSTLLDRELKIGKKRFIVQKCSLRSIGNGKVSLKVDFTGSRKGYVFLIGTPTVDSNDASVSFPDLKFDAKTNSILLNVAKWILNEKITNLLREKSTFDFSEPLSKIKFDVTSKLNEPWANGVSPSGELNDIKVNSIYPLREKLLLRANLNGTLKVSLSGGLLSIK